MDENDWSDKIELIVDQLQLQADSRESVTEIVKELNTAYGIKKPVVRAVAAAVFKRKIEELEEQSNEVISLIHKCKI